MKKITANYQDQLTVMGIVGTVVPSAVVGFSLGLSKAYNVPVSGLETIAIVGLPLIAGASTIGFVSRNRALEILPEMDQSKQKNITTATLTGASAGIYLSMFSLAAGTSAGYAFGLLSKLYNGD